MTSDDSRPPEGHLVFDQELTFIEPVRLEQASTAIVVTDMQYHDAAAGQALNLALERVAPGCLDYFLDRIEQMTIPALSRLITSCRELDVTVIYLTLGAEHRDLRDLNPRLRSWVRRLEERSGVADILWKGNPAFAIRDEIAPHGDDVVVNKTAWGAFNSSPIHDVLVHRGIKSLVMTGVTTNCCVETTARDAADRGYGVVIVDECTADFDQRAQDEALRSFHFNFGRVLTTADTTIDALVHQSTI